MAAPATLAEPAATGRPPLEVADIVRRHGPAFLAAHGGTLSTTQRRALADVAACRTAALGGHVQRCADCGQQDIAYNSCRNRHCPKCQGGRTAAWLQREAACLLPVPYFHVVFTLPQAVAQVVWQHQRWGYTLLFQAAQQTLRTVAANPKHLGAQVGVLAVLHTWGQDLHYHPHLHVVATGGGLACDRSGRLTEPRRWVACRPGFFLPVRVLSRVWRGQFLAGLRQAQATGQLTYHGALAGLTAPAAFAAWLRSQYQPEWVVYAKAPFGGPEQVLKYLARYTHRVALSNGRLQGYAAGAVTFTAKDYAAAGKRRLVRLAAVEFLRRWVQHVLPLGFVKIRHYGLLANRERAERLSCCRALLAVWGWVVGVVALLSGEAAARDGRRCPGCGGQRWQRVGELPRLGVGAAAGGAVVAADTS
jgi:Putative transposase/Transposase zinc-binding domain